MAGSTESDTVSGSSDDCENAIGTTAVDTITGNSLDNILDGYTGNDTLDGSDGVNTCVNYGTSTPSNCQL